MKFLIFYCIIFIFMKSDSRQKKAKDVYEVYQIGDAKDKYAISLAPSNAMYNGNNSYRKARRLPFDLNQNQEVFIDRDFKLDIPEIEKNHKHVPPRIYQMYKQQFDIFQPNFELIEDIPLKPLEFYPTFLSEFSMIDKTYLQTLFITKKVNKKGLYKYFVRRNGEYYVEFIDDRIPIDPQTGSLPWGLSELQPWKIIMMKAWLKQKKTIQAMVNAEPYQFIEAFGFPGYRALSIRKQLNYLASSTLKQTYKEAKQQRIPLEVPGYIIVGKTRNNSRVAEMGLVPNRAGYRIIKARIENQSVITSTTFLDSKGNQIQDHIFKVVSSLPSAWVGQYSIFANGKIHNPQYNQLLKDFGNIYNNFFATYQQISQVFSKFYLVPQYTSNKLSGALIEDSIAIQYHPNEYHVFELVVITKGFININIDLPWDSAEIKKQAGVQSRRYSYIKYFMARREKAENNKELKQFSYYDGEYVKGYHKSCNRFLEIQPGYYYIYFKVEPNFALFEGHILAININSNAKIQSFKKVDPATVHFPDIMQAALHDYNKRYGLKTYAEKKNAEKTKSLVAHISNSLDQIGFGVISISARAPTDMMLAMKIHPQSLKNNNLGIVKQAHNLYNEVQSGPIQIEVKQGEAKTVVVERLIKTRQTQEVFPPPNSVDFYHIM